MRTGNRKAAWTLVALTPVIAELALGSTPIRMIWLLPLWTPIYGAGVLLIREALRRVGGGLGSLLLLGVAYEVVEDGIGLQALTSPHLYGAAKLAPRVLGFNSAYWEANLAYHVVFSVLIPIALTELLFPSHRDRPYLKRTGLIITACCAVLGVALLRVTVPLSQDPGYSVPVPVLAGYVVAIAVLAVLALVVLPRRRRADPPRAYDPSGRVPGRAALAAIGFAGTAVLAGLVFPVGGADHLLFTHGAWSFVPMAVAAVGGVALLVLIRRWTLLPCWTDRSALALMGGALVGHTVVGMLSMHGEVIDRVGLGAIALLTIGGCALLDRRLARRAAPAAEVGAGADMFDA
ncbi:MAG TPA: hypothetical protein VGL93_06170 [Streptosporangiaceae bacterium]|jgi:hypothetical protein